MVMVTDAMVNQTALSSPERSMSARCASRQPLNVMAPSLVYRTSMCVMELMTVSMDLMNLVSCALSELKQIVATID